MERTVCSLHAQRVGELDLAAGARLHTFDLGEHVRCQHVAPDDDEIARGILDRRLFDHRPDADDTELIELGRRIDDAVRTDLIPAAPA